MCDFHIFIAIFDDISPFHHFDHFFVNFFSCGVWGGGGGVAGGFRGALVVVNSITILQIGKSENRHDFSSSYQIPVAFFIYIIYII